MNFSAKGKSKTLGKIFAKSKKTEFYLFVKEICTAHNLISEYVVSVNFNRLGRLKRVTLFGEHRTSIKIFKTIYIHRYYF
jgi:hypothetical protein